MDILRKVMTICGAIACICLTVFLIHALIPRVFWPWNRPVETIAGLTLLLCGTIFFPAAIIYGSKNGLASLNGFHRIAFFGLAIYVGRFLLALFSAVAA